MAAEIKAGDVVQLKSGGPPMTVEWTSTSQGGKPFARCVWFDGTEKKDAAVDLVALKPAEEPPGPVIA